MHGRKPPFHALAQGPRLTECAHPVDTPLGILLLPDEVVQEQLGHQASFWEQTRIVQGFFFPHQNLQVTQFI